MKSYLFLFAAAIAALSFASCKSDESAPSDNYIRYDGQTYEIRSAGVELTYETSGGNLFFAFSPNLVAGSDVERFWDTDHVFMLGMLTEDLGKTVDLLTEVDVYMWAVLYYYAGDFVLDYWSDSNLESIGSCVLTARKIRDRNYSINLTIELTDGKKFELHYSGPMATDIDACLFCAR